MIVIDEKGEGVSTFGDEQRKEFACSVQMAREVKNRGRAAHGASPASRRAGTGKALGGAPASL
jgi:hypothetical protein